MITTYRQHTLALLFGAWALATFLFPARLRAQNLAREALSIFPADTQQVTYSNLAQLRDRADYGEIRPRLVNHQLSEFENFLRSAGTDPEKDVDEVMLGWRGNLAEGSSYFGFASGRFDPERAREYFVQHQVPSRSYLGQDLYAFGSGEDRDDLFFAYFNSSSAAFGRLQDLKTLVDVQAGNKPPLDSNPDFVGWEGQLEGTASQWGIASGDAARNEAAPWLSGGAKLSIDPKAFLAPIQAVLYRVEWGGGFTAHLSILCQSAESASALAQVINLWKQSRSATADASQSHIARFLQGLEVQADGTRVELTGSGPIEAIEQVFRGPLSSR